jgi:hypothetical protein
LHLDRYPMTSRNRDCNIDTTIHRRMWLFQLHSIAKCTEAIGKEPFREKMACALTATHACDRNRVSEMRDLHPTPFQHSATQAQRTGISTDRKVTCGFNPLTPLVLRHQHDKPPVIDAPAHPVPQTTR